MNRKFVRNLATVICVAVIAAFCGFTSPESVFAETGTITVNTAKVRSQASTTSDIVGSLTKGSSIEVSTTVTDTSGQTWYQVTTNGTVGYIRSDLMTLGGTTAATATSTQTTTTTTTTTAETTAKATESLPETQVTDMDSQSAVVTTTSAIVRTGAGKKYSVAGSVKKGSEVTVTGSATGTDSKKWYRITFNNGSTGFVRSDLVEIGGTVTADKTEDTNDNTEDAADTADEAADASSDAATGMSGDAASLMSSDIAASAATAATEATTEASDEQYTLVHETDDSGNDVLYLYDNFAGNKYQVEQLLNTANSSSAIASMKSQNSTMKMLMIVMGILVIILAIVMVILINKLRNADYDDGDDYRGDDDGGYRRYNDDDHYDRPGNKGNRKNSSDDEDSDNDADNNRSINDDAGHDADNRDDNRGYQDDDRYSRSDRDDEDDDDEADDDDYDRAPKKHGLAGLFHRKKKYDDYDDEDDDEDDEDDEDEEEVDDRHSRRRSRRGRNDDYELVEDNTPEKSRKPRNFVDDDDFEFEFLDLDSDDQNGKKK